MSWDGFISAKYCLASLISSWFARVDQKPFRCLCMCPLIVADDIGRCFSNTFSSPGNELSWSFSIAFSMVVIGGENKDWWWYCANSALVVVSWAFWVDSNSDASLLFCPPSLDPGGYNLFIRVSLSLLTHSYWSLCLHSDASLRFFPPYPDPYCRNPFLRWFLLFCCISLALW